MKVGRIEFSPISRIRLSTDKSVLAVKGPINDAAAALVQLQALVADLIERVEKLEQRA